MRCWFRAPSLFGLLVGLSPVVGEAPAIDYARDIRPILSNHCYQCHGPDGKERKAGLRLDLATGAFAELESGGKAIVAGHPEESLLVERIHSDDPDLLMPPADLNKPLSDEQKELLERWIKAGADWKDHWAFQVPVRPGIPKTKDTHAENPIDPFIRARLESEGLSPSGPADPATIYRRVSFDLIGLPPTLEELDTFLADRSADAFDRAVDRLLASPRHGEHMARYWLDAARYGDTHGLHLDNFRSMWPYRDWVVDSFNRNIPFDQFTIEQLAGDLLPEPSIDQRIASGFNRCNVTTSEGGSIDEEYYVRYTVDRVETTGTVFMGLTLGCAVCHDHKYDPLTQKDFYQLFAYFNNLTEKPMDGNAQDPPPTVRIASVDQQKRMTELNVQTTILSQLQKSAEPGLVKAQAEWEEEWTRKLGDTWTIARPTQLTSTGGSTFRPLDDGSILVEGENPAKDAYEILIPFDQDMLSAIRLEALTHESMTGGGPGRASNGNFVLSEFEVDVVSTEDPATARSVRFVRASADYEQANGEYFAAKTIDGVVDGTNGWAVDGNTRHENRTAVFIPDPATTRLDVSTGRALRIRMRHESQFGQHAIGRFRISLAIDPVLSPVVLGDWQVTRPYAAEDATSAYKTDFGPEQSVDLSATGEDGQPVWSPRPEFKDGAVHALAGEKTATYLYRTFHVPERRSVTFSLGTDDAVKLWIDGQAHLEKDVRRGLKPDEDSVSVELDAGEHALLMKVVNDQGAYAFTFRSVEDPGAQRLLEIGTILVSAPRTQAQNDKIRDYYRSQFSETWRDQQAQLAQLQTERAELEKLMTPTLVMQEMSEERAAYLLYRGEYDKRRDQVPRATPAVLPPIPEGAPNNRLGLAKWLVSPTHPLTARVTVNRFWQRHFGQGIVRTAEDFGIQGEFPSHPELLDWLATEFVAEGWDIKELTRLLVTSATYRQDSRVNEAILKRDPQNRLLARGPRYRLDAESIRDNALYLSGLYVELLGGPSVKPYQPPGIWEAVGYTSSNTAKFERETGPALYRRSLYTFWKRTAHPPALQAFDAPSREQCTVRRGRTNTPLQALVLMNDEQYVECARFFAQRTLLGPAQSDADRLHRAFRQATARDPSDEEVAVLTELLNEQRKRFQGNSEAAKELLGVGEAQSDSSLDPGELAAWTMLANLILNLDETITKG